MTLNSGDSPSDRIELISLQFITGFIMHRSIRHISRRLKSQEMLKALHMKGLF
jgi:hypothetical protein